MLKGRVMACEYSLALGALGDLLYWFFEQPEWGLVETKGLTYYDYSRVPESSIYGFLRA